MEISNVERSNHRFDDCLRLGPNSERKFNPIFLLDLAFSYLT